MMALLAQILVAAGMIALACSMSKQHRDLFGHLPTRAWELGLRTVGWLLLTAGLGTSFAFAGIAYGFVLWVGLLTAGALFAAIILAYRENWWRQ